MYTITKEIGLDMGHRVPFHSGGCRHLHGHRYRVIAHLCVNSVPEPDPSNSQSAMVVDFKHVKQAMMESIHDPYDHKLCLWVRDDILPAMEELLIAESLEDGLILVPCIPTAEELACFWFGLLSKALEPHYPSKQVQLKALQVWETPTSMAEYAPGTELIGEVLEFDAVNLDKKIAEHLRQSPLFPTRPVGRPRS